MGVVEKLKGLLPATRRSVQNVDAKISALTVAIEEVSSQMKKMNKDMNRLSLQIEEQVSKKLVMQMDKELQAYKQLETHVKTIQSNTNALQDNVGRIREEVHNSFVTVKAVQNEVHDNHKYIKLGADQSLKLQEQVNIIKNLTENGRKGICDYKKDKKLIVSLTSYPGRIHTTAAALERIFAQSMRPDKIVLWLSVDNFPKKEEELPLQLLQMCERGLEIEWCQGDIKSYKKLIPALQKYPEDIIITLDDDLFYELDLVERLYNSYRQFPKAVSAMRTHKITFDEEGNILPYSEWVKDCSDYILQPRMELFATTGAGTLFPPHVLSQAVCDWESFMEIAPTADDIWVKGMSLLANTPVVLVRENKPLRYIDGTQEETLWRTNMVENDGQLKRIFEKYKIDANSMRQEV